MNNNLKELVKLLDSLKKAYMREIENNNLEKAAKIKSQIPRIIDEIKKIKEGASLEGETVNINNLDKEFRDNMNIDTLEITEDEYDDQEYDEYDDQEYDEYDDQEYDEYDDQEYDDQDIQEKPKSLRKIKKELAKEKKKLKKIALKKQKEEKKRAKLLKNEEKYTKSYLKNKEKANKKNERKSYWIERKERKDSQLKEPKLGTIIIFSLVFIMIILSFSRSYIYTTALNKEVVDSAVHYISMYNFFVRLYIIFITGTILVFSFIQSDLINRRLIRIFTLLSGILLFISFGGIPISFLDLQGNKYLIIPGVCAIILLHLIGKVIVRDKVHYDLEYN